MVTPSSARSNRASSKRKVLKNKRIGLVSGPLSRANGGVFEAIAAHAAMLSDLGGQPVVIGIADEHTAQDRARFGDVEVQTVEGRGPGQLAYAPNLGRTLDRARLDLLHLHGVWQYPVHAAGRWARRSGKPLAVSPHGMFDPWITSRGRTKKAVARIVWERRGWRSASLFHALTEAEAADIEREVQGTQVAVIPNAAPPAGPPRNAMPGSHFVYLGRIHPKKGLDALICAWEQIGSALPDDARLTIAGWGDEPDVAALRRRLAISSDTIRFVGPKYGLAKDDLLRSARALVLPSLSEGLPMVLLEAWAAGTPTIQTAACHLPEGPESGAGWAVETDAASIADALRAALSQNEVDWLVMSRAAQALAAGPFARSTIARSWATIYCRLMGHAA